MGPLEALVLGVIQGLTEFLPVSSSGHLVLAQEILDAKFGQGILFEVAVHIATLFAILIFYRRRVANLAYGTLTRDHNALQYVGKLVVGTLPAVAVALLLRSWIEEQFNSLLVVGICLIATGFIVWSTRYTNKHTGAEEPGWGAAFLIGCVQAFAILPGISRSGSTVAMGLALGLSPLAAAEFEPRFGAPVARARSLPTHGRHGPKHARPQRHPAGESARAGRSNRGAGRQRHSRLS